MFRPCVVFYVSMNFIFWVLSRKCILPYSNSALHLFFRSALFYAQFLLLVDCLLWRHVWRNFGLRKVRFTPGPLNLFKHDAIDSLYCSFRKSRIIYFQKSRTLTHVLLSRTLNLVTLLLSFTLFTGWEKLNASNAVTYWPSSLNHPTFIPASPHHYSASSSLVTLTCPPASSSLQIADCSFLYLSPNFWYHFPASFVNLIPDPTLIFLHVSHHLP